MTRHSMPMKPLAGAVEKYRASINDGNTIQKKKNK